VKIRMAWPGLDRGRRAGALRCRHDP